MDKLFHLYKNVQPNEASMVIGLDGWVNAGEASTLSVRYLIDRLRAEKIGKITFGRFYVYQIQRPLVSIKRGVVQDYRTIRNNIFYWTDKKEKCIVFLLGVEPHLDWMGYSQAVLDVAESLRVNRIYTLGGYLIDASLTKEPFITGSSNNSKLLAELRSIGIQLIDYNGPTSVYQLVFIVKSSGRAD